MNTSELEGRSLGIETRNCAMTAPYSGTVSQFVAMIGAVARETRLERNREAEPHE